jgi:hypothetical protein
MSTNETIAGLFVALQKRETLISFLEANNIPWNDQKDGSTCDLNGVAFEPNNERRLARFWDSGSFRDLIWG